MRKLAIAAGVFFLITEVAAMGGRVLYGPVLNGAEYIVGTGADTRVLWGAFLEIILVFAIIGTGVALYPVVKRQNESVALGYLTARIFEAVVIMVGIIAIASVVTLRQPLAATAGGEAASLAMIGESLTAFHAWTFLFGPNFLLGVNSLLLAYLLYRSGLVPRSLAALGLVGGSLIFVSPIAVMFGLYEQISPVGVLAALPVFAFEVSLAIYLIVKGFRSSPATAHAFPEPQPAAALSRA